MTPGGKSGNPLALWELGWLTYWTWTQASGLFHKAVEKGHLVIQTAKMFRSLFYRFLSELFVVFRMLAESVDAELGNLDPKCKSRVMDLRLFTYDGDLECAREQKTESDLSDCSRILNPRAFSTPLNDTSLGLLLRQSAPCFKGQQSVPAVLTPLMPLPSRASRVICNRRV